MTYVENHFAFNILQFKNEYLFKKEINTIWLTSKFLLLKKKNVWKTSSPTKFPPLLTLPASLENMEFWSSAVPIFSLSTYKTYG